MTHSHTQNMLYFQQNRCENLRSQNPSTITVLAETEPRHEMLMPYTRLDGFVSHPV